jgi:predicted metal-dependent phosphoesterase TrpH
MQFPLDLHNHSRWSKDSFLDPLAVLRTARKRGLRGMAITDHGTIRGGLEARRVNPFDDFLVIVGAEIRTEIGDVVGLFLEKEITGTTFAAVAAEIHAQNGLVLLPHPGKLPTSLVQPFLPQIDLIEVWNARSKPKWNHAAALLAEEARKPVTAASDAHGKFEIARAYTILEVENLHTVRDDLLKAPRTLVRRRTNFYLSHVLSVLTERWKQRF